MQKVVLFSRIPHCRGKVRRQRKNISHLYVIFLHYDTQIVHITELVSIKFLFVKRSDTVIGIGERYEINRWKLGGK